MVEIAHKVRLCTANLRSLLGSGQSRVPLRRGTWCAIHAPWDSGVVSGSVRDQDRQTQVDVEIGEWPHMVPSALAKVDRSHIVTEPFPHIVIPDALPEDFYSHLSQTFPEGVVDIPSLRNNKAGFALAKNIIDNEAMPSEWREFVRYHCSHDFFREILDLWGGYIKQSYPNIPEQFGKPIEEFSSGIRCEGRFKNPANQQQDIGMDCAIGVNSPVERVSSVRGPHVDTKYKLFNSVLYFRHPDDKTTGGDLAIYRYKNKRLSYSSDVIDRNVIDRMPFTTFQSIPARHVVVEKAVSYAPNTLVMWLNTPYSIHAVTPRSVTPNIRRYVNFFGECFRGGENGFFRDQRERSSVFRMLFGK